MHLAQAGHGEPIVMLHGWPQHWYLWRRVILLLVPQARVICPDLRGFGWTDAPGGRLRPRDDGPGRACAARRARPRADRPGRARLGRLDRVVLGLRRPSGASWRSASCRHGPPEIPAPCSRPGGWPTRSRWPSLRLGDERSSTDWLGSPSEPPPMLFGGRDLSFHRSPEGEAGPRQRAALPDLSVA
jgi:pimeloyl-ACP methyl ester carboxylesterase